MIVLAGQVFNEHLVIGRNKSVDSGGEGSCVAGIPFVIEGVVLQLQQLLLI